MSGKTHIALNLFDLTRVLTPGETNAAGDTDARTSEGFYLKFISDEATPPRQRIKSF